MNPPKQKIPSRIIIYPRDITNITGRNERTSRKLLQKLRLALGKHKDEFITFREFCAYFGIDEELVNEYLT